MTEGEGKADIRREGDLYVAGIDGARMVAIPEGPFLMGSDVKDIFAAEDTLPSRQVWLSTYLIDLFPVTNRQFSLFIDDGGYHAAAHWDPRGWAWREAEGITRPISLQTEGFDGEDQPVSGVSWYEAQAYARWAGRLLPTEAQWEKAARGTDGRRHPWGDPLPHAGLCNFDHRVGRTTPAGSYPDGKSPFGCEDMVGNVNNWCRDWYWGEIYRQWEAGEIDRDPCVDDEMATDLAGSLDLHKCDRGGGFATPFQYLEVLRCASRLHWPPDHREIWNGFRTVAENY